MIQRTVNKIRLLFDYRPDDTPNAPIGDPRVARWYRSIGLFEGQRKKKPLTIHLLQSHDKREMAVLVNGKDLQTITSRSAIRVANRFLKNG